ncbi:MAG: hypothetical protein ACRDKJ_09530 [Actinomycetota bacterium]
MSKRKSTIVVAVAAVLMSSVVGATAVRSPNARATDVHDLATDVVAEAEEQLKALPSIDLRVESPAVLAAVDETLILVVAGRAPTLTEAQSRLEDVNSRFGELQGFYLDEGRHYDVTGLMRQVSPETVAVACPTSDDGHSALDCPDGVETVAELQHTSLELVETAAFPSVSLPSCEDVALALCRESYLAALTSDLGFEPSDWLLLTAFRTKQGAEEFLDLTNALGVGGLVVLQATKLGGGEVGLGQEPHPDGSGPLLGPLDDQTAYQR